MLFIEYPGNIRKATMCYRPSLNAPSACSPANGTAAISNPPLNDGPGAMIAPGSSFRCGFVIEPITKAIDDGANTAAGRQVRCEGAFSVGR